MPPDQQHYNKSYILPLPYNRALLALKFTQCFLHGPSHTYAHSSLRLAGAVASEPCDSPDISNIVEMFVQRFEELCLHFHKMLCTHTAGRVIGFSDAFLCSHSKCYCWRLNVHLFQTEVIHLWVRDGEINGVQRDGLMSDNRKNVSRSTGRISRSFATSSLHWQESATYFSRLGAYPPILSRLLLLSDLLQVCPPFFSFFRLYFITPSFVLTACSLSLCLVSLLVNLSTLVSYFPLTILFYFFVSFALLLVFLFSDSSLVVFIHQTSLFCHCRLVYVVESLSALIFLTVLHLLSVSVAFWVQCCRCFREDIPGVQGSENKKISAHKLENPGVLVINAAQ